MPDAEPMVSRLSRTLACVAAVALSAGAVTLPAIAGAATTSATVKIDNCHVQRSRAGGGFTWFYCGVVTDAPANVSVSVAYGVNLATFKPSTGGTWFSRAGTLRFPGGGEQLRNIKLAVRDLSVSQERDGRGLSAEWPWSVSGGGDGGLMTHFTGVTGETRWPT